MAENRTGPREGLEGAVEGVKGKAKEVAGTVTGHNDLRDEGIAQQDKAESQREVAQKEAEARRPVPRPTWRRRASVRIRGGNDPHTPDAAAFSTRRGRKAGRRRPSVTYRAAAVVVRSGTTAPPPNPP